MSGSRERARAGASRRRHSKTALAKVQNGVTTMRFAVDVDDDDRLVEFPEDTPKEEQREFRERAKERLRCVIPDCRAPLTGAFREGTKERPRRPGFQHLSGTGHEHEPERLAHQMAKAMLGHWARSQHPDLVVDLEKATPDGSRRPDVTVLGRSGHRVYLEVQYSDLTAAEWELRHADLTSDGSTAVWLLGHRPPHFRRTRSGDLAVGKLVQSMCAAGAIPLWVDPIRQEIITAWVHDDEFGPVAPINATAADRWDFVPIAQCTLTRDGVMTPDLENLLRAAARRRAAAAKRESEVRAQEVQRRREAAELKLAREARARAWDVSPVRAWVLARHDGQIPPFVRDPVLPHDQYFADALGLDRRHWKAMVYELTVSSEGELISFETLLEHLARGRSRTYGDGLKSLRELLRRMGRANVIEIEYTPGEPWKVDAVRRRRPLLADATPSRISVAETDRDAPAASAPDLDEQLRHIGRTADDVLEPALVSESGAPPDSALPTVDPIASHQVEGAPTASSMWQRVIRRLGLMSR